MPSQSVLHDDIVDHANPDKSNPRFPRHSIFRTQTQSSQSTQSSWHKPVSRLNSRLQKPPPNAGFADVALVLPSAHLLSTHGFAASRMDWYVWWISEQIANHSSLLLSMSSACEDPEFAQVFMTIWHELATFLTNSPGSSIDDTIRHLVTNGIIPEPTGKEQVQQSKTLIFTVIGWQTMLYRSDGGANPPSFFTIADETCGYRGRAHMKLRESQTCSREPLDKFLLRFGVILPPKNYDLSATAEHKQAFNGLREVDSSILNASLLVNVGRFELIWTDSLACHLELDLANSRLYLFRFPSFCVATRAANAEQEKGASSPLYACAKTTSGNTTWASMDEISDLLDETLLSYRLLFGQNKQSRRLFRKSFPFSGLPAQAYDKVLQDLCGRKRFNTILQREERKNWVLEHDFPVLRSRLSTLAYEMSIRKPRTWSQLWSDKRDSAHWATFWTVLIIGVISLFLSALQVILQAIQIKQSQ